MLRDEAPRADSIYTPHNNQTNKAMQNSANRILTRASSRIITPVQAGPNILIRKHAHQMEAERRQLKTAWGERYHTRVGTWRSLIVKDMKQRKCGAYDAAMNFISILKGRKKLKPMLRAVIQSAALDVMEMKLA